MIDIVTYITEGGFFTNTGANKYIDTIKNFGDIIATGVMQEEFIKARYTSNMPETKTYKKLYDLFNDINKYKVSFDIVYSTLVPKGRGPGLEPDICTQRWICVRNGSEFSFLIKDIYEKHPEENTKHSFKRKTTSEFLSEILYYLQTVGRPDILRDTAKFTIK